MNDITRSYEYLRDRNVMVHEWLLRAGKGVTSKQFQHKFSEHAPPIGWHLWHMARFADRLQMRLAHFLGEPPTTELWHGDNYARQWGIEATDLGVHESGMGQSHQAAQNLLVRVGQDQIIHYAAHTFARCNELIKQLTEAQYDQRYFGILDYGYDPESKEVWAVESVESTIAQDLVFHSSHGSRHMGMMEALTGLQGSAGTLSV